MEAKGRAKTGKSSVLKVPFGDAAVRRKCRRAAGGGTARHEFAPLEPESLDHGTTAAYVLARLAAVTGALGIFVMIAQAWDDIKPNVRKVWYGPGPAGRSRER